MRKKVWECRVGETERRNVPKCADEPMREVVEEAYHKLTGEYPDFIFSGWDAELDTAERAVVNDETPRFSGADLIAIERKRQVENEKRTPEHDDRHEFGEMRIAAAELAVDDTDASVDSPREPDAWGLVAKHGWKTNNTVDGDIRRLSIAGALIAAEIDRLQRKKSEEYLENEVSDD